jgi:hypothetical protein
MKKYLYLIFALWLAIIIVALAYWVPLFTVIWSHIPDIALLFLILFASFSIGSLFFSTIKLDFNSPLESFCFNTVLGFGVLAYITLLFGLLGWLFKPLFYIILFVPIVLSFKKIITLGHEAFQRGQATFKEWSDNSNYLSFALFFFILFSLGISLILSLTPPKFFDIVGYHLAIPNQYVIMGKITYFPHSALSNYPFLIHMLFTMALLLKGDVLANMMSFIFFPITLIALYSVCRRFWSSSASLYAVAIASSIPSAMQMATMAMVDIPFACFLFLTFYSLIMYLQNFFNKWLITSSIFCGLTLGIKYTAFFYALGLFSILLIIYKLINKKGIKRTAIALLIFIVFALIVSSPWWIKNYIYTGNPIFPIFYKYLGGKNWSQAQELRLRASTENKVIRDINVRSLYQIPWIWTVEAERFGIVGGSPGVIFLVFFPLLFVYLKKEKFIQVLLLYSFLYFIVWLLTFQQGRFALTMLFCMSIILGHSINELLQSIKPYWRFILAALLLFLMVINVAILFWDQKRIIDPLPYLLGLETKDQYLSRAIQAYPAINYINNHLAEEAVILFIGETRNFYCKRKCISPSAHDIQPIIPILRNAQNPEQAVHILQKTGITHILFSQKETARLQKYFPATFGWTTEDKEKLAYFFNSQCEILFQEQGVFLLAIKEKNERLKENLDETEDN